MVPPSSVKITRVPTYLICEYCTFMYGAITLYRQVFQLVPLTQYPSAVARSLAATKAISIDFSSYGYLDVSVPRVCLLHLCIQCKIPTSGGFPHSEIFGYNAFYQLPKAYRRLTRPSSPLTAKASTVYA